MEYFDEYEDRCKIIRQDNYHLLDEFAVWLRKQLKTLEVNDKEATEKIDQFLNTAKPERKKDFSIMFYCLSTIT